MKRHDLIKVVGGKEIVVYSGTQKSHMTRMMQHILDKGGSARIKTHAPKRKRIDIREFLISKNLLRRYV